MKGTSKFWAVLASSIGIFGAGCAGGYVSGGYSEPVYAGPYYYDPYPGPNVYVYPRYDLHEYRHRGDEYHHFHEYSHAGRPPGAVHGGDRGGQRHDEH